MQRRAGVAGAAAAAALVFALSGCTDSGGDDPGTDAKSDSASGSPSPAPAGKYRSLPEPCTAVERSTLLALLPVPDDGKSESKDNASGKAREEVLLGGKPALTFDTDRRVGCSWERTSVDGDFRLRIDFERVVSYDPAVSDDTRATQVFARKAQEHGVSSATGQGPPHPGATPSGSASAGASATGAPTEGDPAPAAPRRLEEPGDEAFLDEVVQSPDSGVRRDVTVIFRTANVVVTVEYGQSLTDPSTLPDAAELQQRTQELAGKLAERFTD
ncbi:DUF3558 domain-containing protein [Streptomyces sp. NPDC051940]|uniref:DUF3558 domain-containing protein n=1 Tax=Streptomyces sp. NPDC051940 TaxID=3155675 RepID=UPI00344A0761